MYGYIINYEFISHWWKLRLFSVCFKLTKIFAKYLTKSNCLCKQPKRQLQIKGIRDDVLKGLGRMPEYSQCSVNGSYYDSQEIWFFLLPSISWMTSLQHQAGGGVRDSRHMNQPLHSLPCKCSTFITTNKDMAAVRFLHHSSISEYWSLEVGFLAWRCFNIK